MKKIIIALVAVIGFALAGHAQKFAMIDMEYVLRNVPAYEMANTQLSQVSQRWEKEVNELAKEADNLYKTYQSEMVFLSDDQKKAREAEIVKKEDEVSQLRNKYFGPEGELYKKRQSLMKPIQEDVYNAVKSVAEEKGYQAIFDRASSQSIVFASPRIDISNDVLAKLGYAK